jgi:hypothetical protein
MDDFTIALIVLIVVLLLIFAIVVWSCMGSKGEKDWAMESSESDYSWMRRSAPRRSCGDKRSRYNSEKRRYESMHPGFGRHMVKSNGDDNSSNTSYLDNDNIDTSHLADDYQPGVTPDYKSGANYSNHSTSQLEDMDHQERLLQYGLNAGVLNSHASHVEETLKRTSGPSKQGVLDHDNYINPWIARRPNMHVAKSEAGARVVSSEHYTQMHPGNQLYWTGASNEYGKAICNAYSGEEPHGVPDAAFNSWGV